MRGRRGQPSSSGAQEQNRMVPRKQLNKDAADIPSGSQQVDTNTQEDNREDSDELSSSLLPRLSLREKRKRERENRSKPKEMTEEEMMDLALRLSEQEASITALRLQKEEETMMKAIQESMLSQTQPCVPSQSQSLLTDGGPVKIGSRRKLLYSNGKTPADNQGASEETDPNQAKQSGDERNSWNEKRRRKEGSPLPEMPDLSQTQKTDSKASDCSSDVVELLSDSPQSCDSTQIEECQLHESPVFPSTGCRAEVHVPRLSQDLLQTCRTSGFVLCSQDSLTSSLKTSSARPQSPTFPKSPKRSIDLTEIPKSPVFSETDQGDDGETELGPEYFKSPVFGRNTQHEKSSSACKPQVSACNSGFTFSTQDSLTSSERTASCRPKSPVFPKCPSPPKNLPDPERSATRESPVSPETCEAQTEQSPVFGRTGQQQKVHIDVQKCPASPSAAEFRVQSSDAASGSSPSLGQDSETDHDPVIRFNLSSKSDDEDENIREISKDRDSAEMELTSDMTLLWSEEDEDVTPVGSPSPVFPEERPLNQDNSLNHVTAPSPGTTRSNCRPSSSSTPTVQLQVPTTEQKQQPISSQGTVGKATVPPGELAGGTTVHYYWGVPFCPRGLDPDDYTQVILTQMEVYEKSLKRAQRCLLRKAEWGEAILPQPEKSPSPEPPAESHEQLIPRRRGLKLKSKKVCDAADASPAGAEEEEDKRAEEEKREKKEEERNEGGGGEQVDSDDCEVCPETQLSDHDDDDRTQDLTLDNEAAAELRPKSLELPEVDLILPEDSSARDKLQEEEMEVDVDAPVDRKMMGGVPVSSGDDGRQNVREQEADEDMEDPNEEEMKNRGLQRSTSPELEAQVPQVPESSVDCPICQGSFPVTEIEMHAAYCDGEADDRRPEADCFQVSSKQRRKRTRRTEVTAEDTDDTSNTGRNQEKCFICLKAVPLRDYNRHTELCIQRKTVKTAARENLLSALEKTESRDSEAGPSGSKLQSGDVIDLRDDDDDEEGEEEEEEGSVSAICISNSPIRSFTPISEATDCLIDFKKQQQAKKPSRRRR